jgi:AraC-like DNA-binding protein
VDDLIVFSGMKKRTFYRKLDTDYNLTPNQLIQILKEKKARKLIKENPDIQMDIIAKNTGFSISNLYLILKEEETHLTGNAEILNSLRY